MALSAKLLRVQTQLFLSESCYYPSLSLPGLPRRQGSEALPWAEARGSRLH